MDQLWRDEEVRHLTVLLLQIGDLNFLKIAKGNKDLPIEFVIYSKT